MGTENLTLVTVTYGDRIGYLLPALSKSLADPLVSHAVVVSNGSRSDFSVLEKRFRDRITLVRLPKNQGSSVGYQKGIRMAILQGADYIQLLDDDNALEENAAECLRSELDRMAVEFGKDCSAVLGLRATDAAAIRQRGQMYFPDSCFLGFCILDVPKKIVRRVFGKEKTLPMPEVMQIPYAQFGGLMAHRSVFERLGDPKVELVLYADDWEYTLRLTRNGGKIHLVTNAIVSDLETTYYASAEQMNSFERILRTGSDFRLYYGIRNHTWLRKHVQARSMFMYHANKLVYLAILYATALKIGKWERLTLIRQAILDGEAGWLGIRLEYPLPDG